MLSHGHGCCPRSPARPVPCAHCGPVHPGRGAAPSPADVDVDLVLRGGGLKAHQVHDLGGWGGMGWDAGTQVAQPCVQCWRSCAPTAGAAGAGQLSTRQGRVSLRHAGAKGQLSLLHGAAPGGRSPAGRGGAAPVSQAAKALESWCWWEATPASAPPALASTCPPALRRGRPASQSGCGAGGGGRSGRACCQPQAAAVMGGTVKTGRQRQPQPKTRMGACTALSPVRVPRRWQPTRPAPHLGWKVMRWP